MSKASESKGVGRQALLLPFVPVPLKSFPEGP